MSSWDNMCDLVYLAIGYPPEELLLPRAPEFIDAVTAFLLLLPETPVGMRWQARLDLREANRERLLGFTNAMPPEASLVSVSDLTLIAKEGGRTRYSWEDRSR